MGTGWGKDLKNISVSVDMVDEYVAQHNTSFFARKDLSAPSVKLKAFKFAVGVLHKYVNLQWRKYCILLHQVLSFLQENCETSCCQVCLEKQSSHKW